MTIRQDASARPGPPWLRRGLAVLSAVTLVAGAGIVYLHRPAHPLTVTDAVRHFREVQRQRAEASVIATSGASTTAATRRAGGAGGAGTPQAPTTLPSTAARHPQTSSTSGAGPQSGRLVSSSSTVATSTTVAAPSAPPAGVYVYNTVGYEDTSALGGAHHTYPAQTTITIEPVPCGWTQRWQPLDERWDEWTMCLGPAGEYGSHFTTFHEFFNQTQQQDFSCPPTTFFLPANAQAGQHWSIDCSGPSGAARGTASLVAFESVSVAGASIRAAHLHLDLTLSGTNQGTETDDLWLDPHNHLPVQAASVVDAQTSSPFGDVHYDEHYQLQIVSETPQS